MGSCRRCQAGGRLERAPKQVGIRSGGHTGVGKCDHRSDEWSTEQAGFRVIAQMSASTRWPQSCWRTRQSGAERERHRASAIELCGEYSNNSTSAPSSSKHRGPEGNSLQGEYIKQEKQPTVPIKVRLRQGSRNSPRLID